MMNSDVNMDSDGFLASTSDLASLLAQLAAPRQRNYSSRGRQDAFVAKAAINELFTGPMSTGQQVNYPEPSAPIQGKAASAQPRSGTPRATNNRCRSLRGASESACPTHPKRERLRAEILALLQSKQVIRTAPVIRPLS